MAALFGCSKRQKAWEHDDLKHGVFFHAVLEGLAGKAKNEDGEVTWERCPPTLAAASASRCPT